MATELGKAEEGGGSVMVGMEKGEGLLLEKEEDGVDKLEVFGKIIELGGCQLVS